ncbi:MAG TPA: class I SAM-dependent methyltransferase [Chloroflexota bacterium]|jgi:ubiquinone/menaquinone biosynthesis C-methylase UbiE
MAFLVDPDGVERQAVHALVGFVGRKVLEIGCGDGRLTRRYAARAGSVLALDPKPEEIARAERTMPEPLRSKVAFRVADVTIAELPAGTFDVALFARSL